MLTQLTVQNFGLIDKVVIEFLPKLNILTGETGAGKSIIIDALRSVLGERLDSAAIRNTTQPLFIEAVFEINNASLKSDPAITEFLTSDDDQLIVQRSLSSDGKSKNKINGMSVTLSQLKAVGNLLIDFHGPHDHQMLLDQSNHLGLLDQLVDFKNTLDDYKKQFKSYEETSKELTALNNLAQMRQRDLDLLTHQVKELESVPLSEEKYNALMLAQHKINNAQRLHDHIQSLLNLLDDEEAGAHVLLRKAFNPLKALVQIDAHAAPLLEQLNTAQEHIGELISKLNDYADSLEFDPHTAQEIRNQCDIYDDIKRKYGPTLDDAQQFYINTKSKLDLIKDFEHNDKSLREKLLALDKELNKSATKITKLRQKAATDLNSTIETELKELGINHVTFDVRFEKTPFNINGHDRVTFYISPNAGEDLKPLADIVSSGEAARVMLALKKALIKVDPIPVLIFDEIDAQIGGRLGSITGKKLKELSQYRQVILITHLPQIASFADIHFKIIKNVKSGRATTEVTTLTDKLRIEEIAQMMSGQDTHKIALSHAQEMITQAQRIKS